MSRRFVGCVAALALAWSPAAASDADVEAADAVRFQAYLHARQYPADCRPTVGLLTRTGNQPDGTPYAGNCARCCESNPGPTCPELCPIPRGL